MLTLQGNWCYSLEDNPAFSDPEFNDATWKGIQIPQNWFLSGLDHHGVLWLRHEFEYRLPVDRYATLHFDGIDYFADVYLNGAFLGHHAGYFEPFSFDVTRKLKSGKNILAVRVNSPYEPVGASGWHMRKELVKGVLNHHDCRPGGGWEPQGQAYNTGGVWNRVYLDEHGAVTIEQSLLEAKLSSQTPGLHIQVRVNNRAGAQNGQLKVDCRPDNFKGKAYHKEVFLDLPSGESTHHLEMQTENIRLWQPWDRGQPNLYKVELILNIPTKTESRFSTCFGFRTVQVDEVFNWTINGERYFPRGSNYIASQWLSETIFPEVASAKSHPFGGRPFSKTGWFEHDVDLMKKANLNIVRVHAHVIPQEFHAACDRAGMLVWQDFPLQWGYSDNKAFHDEAERQIQAMVSMLYNHPSIVAWCCHNESPWDAPWMEAEADGNYDRDHNRSLDIRLEAAVKSLDSTRYVHRNSGTGDGHTYPGWYFGHWRDYRDLPAAPFPTEYGAQGLPCKESLQRTFPQFGPEAGHTHLVRFKTWLEEQKGFRNILWLKKHLGGRLVRLEKNETFKPLVNRLKKWGMKSRGFPYSKIPPLEATPTELHPAREVWETWRFHNFQPQETFEDNRVALGDSLETFSISSQAYQSHLIQYATELYRRNKYKQITGIFQFDFSDPWPAITWSVVDYWRAPKASYEAFRRAMQPVLPSFTLPPKIRAGKGFRAQLCIVNDLRKHYPDAKVVWKLEKEKVRLDGKWVADIPADDVSPAHTVTFPALEKGHYRLTVAVHDSRDKPLGENFYMIESK